MKQFQGAVFGLDGILLDSMGIRGQIDRDTLGRRGIPVPEDYAQAVALLGFWQLAEYAIRRFGLLDTPQQLTEERHQMAQDVYRFRAEFKPGVREYLPRLRGQGVSFSIATSSHRELFLPTLERHGTSDWFDATATVSEVSRGKGFPDIYEEAARRMRRLPQECVVFEDLPDALRGARDGGFCTMGVFDSYSKDEEIRLRRMLNRFIYDFREPLQRFFRQQELLLYSTAENSLLLFWQKRGLDRIMKAIYNSALVEIKQLNDHFAESRTIYPLSLVGGKLLPESRNGYRLEGVWF